MILLSAVYYLFLSFFIYLFIYLIIIILLLFVLSPSLFIIIIRHDYDYFVIRLSTRLRRLSPNRAKMRLPPQLLLPQGPPLRLF